MDRPRNGARNAGKCRKNWAYQRKASTTSVQVATANQSRPVSGRPLIRQAAANAATTKITMISAAMSVPVAPRCSSWPIPLISRSRFCTGVRVGTTRNTWAAKKLL